MLQWRSAPDLEAEADLGGTPGDNVFEITLVAWDKDWEIGRRDVTIQLSNSNDTGKITLSHIRPQVGKTITATVTDQDGISEEITWQWYRGTGTSTAITDPDNGSDTPSYTVQSADNDNQLTVKATYTDIRGNSEEMTATTVKQARNNPTVQTDPTTNGRNTPPKFYKDGVVLTTAANRSSENETTLYERFILENHSTHVTKTELEARVDTDTDTAGIQVPQHRQTERL